MATSITPAPDRIIAALPIATAGLSTRADAPRRHRCEAFSARNHHAAGFGAGDHGLRQRVLGLRFHRRGERQQFGLVAQCSTSISPGRFWARVPVLSMTSVSTRSNACSASAFLS
nr:hypothetical protein [Sphingomonas gei]